METQYTHRVDLENLTVIAFDVNGEGWDLNARGEPCANSEELRSFVCELHEQGFYSAETRDRLLGEIDG